MNLHFIFKLSLSAKQKHIKKLKISLTTPKKLYIISLENVEID